MTGNGWDEYRRDILRRLDELHENQRRLYERMERIGRELAALKVKSGLWGMAGAAVILLPVAITVAIAVIRYGG